MLCTVLVVAHHRWAVAQNSLDKTVSKDLQNPCRFNFLPFAMTEPQIIRLAPFDLTFKHHNPHQGSP